MGEKKTWSVGNFVSSDKGAGEAAPDEGRDGTEVAVVEEEGVAMTNESEMKNKNAGAHTPRKCKLLIDAHLWNASMISLHFSIHLCLMRDVVHCFIVYIKFFFAWFMFVLTSHLCCFYARKLL